MFADVAVTHPRFGAQSHRWATNFTVELGDRNRFSRGDVEGLLEKLRPAAACGKLSPGQGHGSCQNAARGMGGRMETLARAFQGRADRRRHRAGCFRWYGDGRCVDCGRYTGTAPDVVEVITDTGVVYKRPDMSKQRVGRPTWASEDERVTVAPIAQRPRDERSLTADQLAVRRAWEEWRRRQGDPQPDLPRRQRRG
jgi:hypothetical protein